LNRAAFEAFAGGMAVSVGNDPEAICAWVLATQAAQALGAVDLANGLALETA
jgi:hypothetical protein